MRAKSLKTSGPTDTVDQIISRVNDAGEFDELELVWMLSAYVINSTF